MSERSPSTLDEIGQLNAASHALAGQSIDVWSFPQTPRLCKRIIDLALAVRAQPASTQVVAPARR